MTRFARAKGSKSSNERVPEPATSWSEMRRDLQRESIRKAAEEQIEREAQLERQQNPDPNNLVKSITKKKVTDPVELVSFDDVPSFSYQSVKKPKNSGKSLSQNTAERAKKIQDVRTNKRQHPDSISCSEDIEHTKLFPETDSTRLESLINKNSSSETPLESTSNSLSVKTGGQKRFQGNDKLKHGTGHPSPSKQKPLKQGKFSRDSNDTECSIGGNFKGYPVPKEDAETLTDAYNILRKEGMTHKQAMERIKPERRRAEKRLARLKSMVSLSL